MPIHNADIADIFDEIADYLEIEGDNPFRIRAYRNAARTVRGLGTELKDMVVRNEDLTELPGIGKELAAKIHEILTTGTARALTRLRRRIPSTVVEILKLPGLGPKRVRTLYHDLDILTLEQLTQAAQQGRIRALAGFGARTEQQILEAARKHAQRRIRFKISDAKVYVDSLIAYLKQVPGVNRVAAAGSYRRCRDTIGDLDILVTAAGDSPVMARFAAYDEVSAVISQGATRASVWLRCGLQVDLRRVAPESFGAALQYFTGSRAHNIAIRRLARQYGLKINEYGVFTNERRIAGETETSVYQSVDLDWISPELRENRGEIEACRQKRLPRLIELADIRGDLHMHTRASDGHNSIEEMALAAGKRGLEYIAIAEHSRHLSVAHGLDARRLLKQIDEIDRLNQQLKAVAILKSIEVDILEDGRLDMPDEVLARLDLVVASVHSQFNMARERQTTRILRAMDQPYFSILAHPSGRLINERDAYAVDLEKIIRHAAARGCFLELNANPQRLDLTDVYCQMAKEQGVLVAIDSDAHRSDDFDNLRFGIGQARRGWLEKDDVLNTRPLAELLKLLQRTMG
jgi:DNA polymerase (family 10)